MGIPSDGTTWALAVVTSADAGFVHGGEGAQAMRRQLLSGSARRVAVVSVGIIAVIAAAGAVSTWRFEAARSQAADALDARSDARYVAAAQAAFWHERAAMDEYLLVPAPSLLAKVSAQR